jgi:hypothetical protein
MSSENTSVSFSRGRYFCRACESKDLFVALDLGFSPLANNLVPKEKLEHQEAWYPLVFRICAQCGLGQVGEFATPNEIFSDYPYLSSVSKSWVEANEEFATDIISIFDIRTDDLILEIASNDGYLLQHFKQNGFKVLGIEPAQNVSTIAVAKGILTITEFFGLNLAIRIRDLGTWPKLIVAKNVFAHVPNIQDFTQGLAHLMTDASITIIEAPTILSILTKNQFDTIYHEHFSYLSLKAVSTLMEKFELFVFDAKMVETHGGSIKYFICKKEKSRDFIKFRSEDFEIISKMENDSRFFHPSTWVKTNSDFIEHIAKLKSWFHLNRTKKIAGYGAPAKAVTLLNAARISASEISFIIDNSSWKQGSYLPGSHIPILAPMDQSARDPDIVVILPWNIISELLPEVKRLFPKADVFRIMPNIENLG